MFNNNTLLLVKIMEYTGVVAITLKVNSMITKKKDKNTIIVIKE